MHTGNSDKEQIIQLINRLLERSGLSIDQVVARMQVHGCELSRATFENRFTTRVDHKPNIAPEWVLALTAAFTERLNDHERCQAAEAIELARLAHLPIDHFRALQKLFPEAEFNAAYSRYAPIPAFQPSLPAPTTGSPVPTPLGSPPAVPLIASLPDGAESEVAYRQLVQAQQRQRRWFSLSLALALLVSLALALLALDQWWQVEVERQATFSRRLAAHARDYLTSQYDLALLLSVEAYRTVDTFEARNSLLTALQSSPHLQTYLRGHTGWVLSVTFSPYAQTLASGSADGTERVSEAATGQPLSPP
jgi:hypothetical protein